MHGDSISSAGDPHSGELELRCPSPSSVVETYVLHCLCTRAWNSLASWAAMLQARDGLPLGRRRKEAVASFAVIFLCHQYLALVGAETRVNPDELPPESLI